MTFVIHPHGKRFMSLILDIVMLAAKEVMKRRSFPDGKSFDIEKVTEACQNIKTIETEILSSITSEIQAMRDKIKAIQKLLENIIPARDLPMTFEEFISAWHDYNMTRMSEINKRDEQMESVYQKTAQMIVSAQKMLQSKIRDVFSPPLEDIIAIAEFYENATAANQLMPQPISDGNLNLSWLIAQFHLVLPVIVSYVSNYVVDPSNTSSDELKSLKKYSLELNRVEKRIDDFCTHWRQTIPLIIAKFKQAKEERQRREREQQTDEELAGQEAKKQLEMEKLKLLFEPVYYFDATKECLKNVVVKKNRLALIFDEDGNEDLVNETKLYRSVQSTLANKTRENKTMIKEMGPPPPKQQPRRRFDPMLMLEKANKPSSSRGDLNTTKRHAHPKGMTPLTPKFCSTMLSPDLRQPLFNCSTVSEIPKGSPLNEASILESMFKETNNMIKILEPIKNLNLDQPRTPLSPLTIQWGLSDPLQSNSIVGPDEETIKHQLNSESIDDKTENTINAKQNSSICVDSFSACVAVNDENLFNVSDSLMKNVQD